MRSRPGLTLVELLVVIALVAVLMGLLLPAVQAVRGAAARAACQNNLKQIGLALHSYHDAEGVFPAGITSARRGEKYPYMSWLTRLLPYVEQDALWRQSVSAYERQLSPFAPAPHLVLSFPVALYGCPADSRVSQTQGTHRNRRVALTSYVGSLGKDYRSTTGVLFRDSRVRIADVRDGTSTTLAAGERPPSTDLWYGWWYVGYGQRGTGSGDMLLGAEEVNEAMRYASSCPRGPYRFGPGKTTEQCDVMHFWSLHSGGGHFLFADGSVRFLAYSAAPLMAAFASRAGGEVAELP